MKKERSQRERLQDILDAINLIRAHPIADEEDFHTDEVKRWFCLKQIEIVGEAAWRVDETIRKAHPHIPWKKIAGTRHRLVHDYFELDWQLLLQIPTKEIPVLYRQITKVIHDSFPD